MSFRAYVGARPTTADAAGIFARKAKEDSGLPEFRLWSELETYVLRRNLPDSELEGARHVWREYLHKQGRERPPRRR